MRNLNRAGITVTLLTAVLAALTMTACDESDPDIQSGVMGANGQVGDVLLRSVHVQAPDAPRYPGGADPTVLLTLLNRGSRADALTRVTSPYADRVEIWWDRDCSGAAEAVFGAYQLRIVNLNREVLAGSTIPLTFTFADAGSVQLDAYVQPSTADRPEPEPCIPEPSAASPAPT